MKETLSVAKGFREVVITCRTQFFPSDEEVPTEAGYIKTYGDGGTEYKFQKLYLSVFEDKDIERYLKKRFSIFQRRRRARACKIVEKSPNLVMRPMLLGHIDDLVGEERPFRYSFEIYEFLIEKWIERESQKHAVSEKYGKENYKKLLQDFSQKLAVDLFENKEKRGGYFIEKGEDIGAQLRLDEIENYDNSEKDFKGKSLLNRNAEGKYKFAHKSIFEYFLAKRLSEDISFRETFNFEGMSASENFYYEMLYDDLNKLVLYWPLPMNPKELKHIDYLFIVSLRDFSVFDLLALKNLTKLIIFDAIRFPALVDLYICIVLWRETRKLQDWRELPDIKEFTELVELEEELAESLEEQQKLELREWRRKQNRLEQLEKLAVLGSLEMQDWQRLKERLEGLELKELKERLEGIELLKGLEWQEWLDCLEGLEGLEWLEWLEGLEDRDLPHYSAMQGLKATEKQLELLFRKSDEELSIELKPTNDFLRDMKMLEEKLPDCKIYY